MCLRSIHHTSLFEGSGVPHSSLSYRSGPVMISRAAASRLATSTLRSALPRTSISSTIRRGLVSCLTSLRIKTQNVAQLIPQITGPPAKTPRSRSRSETPTSAPLPSPTPLPEFAIPSYSPYPPTDGSVPDADGKPLYVSGSAAERQAKLSRMSSPLRRGTYESWWTGEMGWFNAVSKVRAPHYDAGTEEERRESRWRGWS